MAQLTNEETSPRLTLGRLRFSDDDLERGFSNWYFEHSLSFARLGISLTIVLYAVFGILDVFIVPNVAKWIWLIRYGIVCPILAAALGVTFTRWFRPIMQPVLSGVAVVAGLGIVAMIAIADPSDGHLYYAGLLLVVPGAYTLLQLRFFYATSAAAVIMAGYELVAIALKPTPVEILVNNNFFFLSAVVIGMVAGYTIERGRRTEFLQRRLIEDQRADLAEHNVHLDSALQASLDEVRRQAHELQASRARIVTAADGERRRIERNLHDGAQQYLAAAAVQLSLASKLADKDVGRAKVVLEQLRRHLQETLEELRNLAHGIYPPLLMDQGLTAALSAAVRRSTLPTQIEADSLRRYPSEVEANVYFCCLEALQNACKYAGEGASVTIRVHEDAGDLVFEVADDGAGFDSQSRQVGAGFVNMSDRLGALGGRLQVESAPGKGTRVIGALPIRGNGDHAAVAATSSGRPTTTRQPEDDASPAAHAPVGTPRT